MQKRSILTNIMNINVSVHNISSVTNREEKRDFIMTYEDLTEEKVHALSDEELIANHSKIIKTARYFTGIYQMFDNEVKKRNLTVNKF